MKGLWMMDWKMLFSNKKLLLIYAALVVFYLFNGLADFALAFSSALMVSVMNRQMIALVDGPGSKFIFTLPFNDREFVIEKFLFGLVICLAFPVLIGAVSLAAGFDSPASLGLKILGVLAGSLILLSVMMPAVIRFGRSAMISITLFVFFIMALVMIASDYLKPYLESLKAALAAVPTGLLCGGIAGLCLLLMVISYFLSVKLIHDRQF